MYVLHTLLGTPTNLFFFSIKEMPDCTSMYHYHCYFWAVWLQHFTRICVLKSSGSNISAVCSTIHRQAHESSPYCNWTIWERVFAHMRMIAREGETIWMNPLRSSVSADTEGKWADSFFQQSNWSFCAFISLFKLFLFVCLFFNLADVYICDIKMHGFGFLLLFQSWRKRRSLTLPAHTQ